MRISLGFVLISVSQLLAQSTPKEALLVLSKGNHTLAIVDPVSLKVIATAPSGPDPHEVIATADGKLAFISNYGFGEYNTLSVMDLITQKALPAVDLGPLRGPHGLQVVGGKVWFTAEAAKVIGSYDPVAKKVDWVLGTGQNRTHMLIVSQDMQRIVTANVSSGTMSIIEKTEVRMGPPPGAPPNGGGGSGGPPPGMRPRKDWDEIVVKVGNGPEGFDISPDGKEIWVATAQDGTVSILDFAAKKVIQTLQANVRGANRLKFTLDGKRVLISTLGGPDVTVLDAATRREVKRIPVGRGAAGILMQPDGLRAFVACTPDDYVAIIDLKSMEVTGKIDAGKGPDGLAWAKH
jgi:DNA-binding beta-propeller fold protein YncE